MSNAGIVILAAAVFVGFFGVGFGLVGASNHVRESRARRERELRRDDYMAFRRAEALVRVLSDLANCEERDGQPELATLIRIQAEHWEQVADDRLQSLRRRDGEAS